MTMAIYGISRNQELHVGNRTEKQKIRKRYHAGGQEDQLPNLLGWFNSIDNMTGLESTLEVNIPQHVCEGDSRED